MSQGTPGGPPQRAVGRRKPNSRLTPYQARFVEAYTTNGGNATKAAAQAGYKGPHPGSAGCEFLKNPKVREACDAVFRLKIMSTEQIAERLCEMANCNPADFYDKKRRLNWKKIEAKGYLLREVDRTKDGVKIKTVDQLAALTTLGKHQGMFKDQVEVGGQGGGPVRHEFVVAGVTPADMDAVAPKEATQ